MLKCKGATTTVASTYTQSFFSAATAAASVASGSIGVRSISGSVGVARTASAVSNAAVLPSQPWRQALLGAGAVAVLAG